jgi:hypothetical protein
MWIAPRLSDGLGNRLFQFAAAAGVAEATGKPLVFFLPRCDTAPHGPFDSMFKLFPSVPLLWSASGWSEVKEEEYMRWSHMEIPEGPTVILGYRQSPKYFKSVEIRPDWHTALRSYRYEVLRSADLSDLNDRKRTVALHVRLGDYRALPHHQEDLAWYYVQALKKVPRGSRIHLFSDEPEVCSNFFRDLVGTFNDLQFTVAEARQDVASLYEMANCLGGTICANSTFSWWGAYFAHQAGAPFATVPNRWGKGLPDPKDLFCDWMTVIDCEPPVEIALLESAAGSP